MKCPVRIAVFLVSILLSLSAACAGCGQDAACTNLTDWSRFTRINLAQTGPGKDDSSAWRGHFDRERGDLRVDVDSRWGRTTMKGSIALIGGRTMLSRGLDLERGYEIDALDAPVLAFQLAMILMTRVFPEGPGRIDSEQLIDHRGEQPIRLATQSAGGTIPAPWTLKGRIRKLPDGSLPFELAFAWTGESGGSEVQMSGSFGMREGPVFEDSASLEGWKVYGVGPQKYEREGSTILDYGARPEQAGDLRTIADIRAAIAAQDHPGERDPGKDFTGFWKQDCALGHGLQIKPYGDDGKYSIVFCGPGGCGDPSEGRPTFISGDPHYEVVSEDEIVELGRDGERSRYHRCTRETHPLLRHPE